MSQFLFIESQDPYEDKGAEAYLGYALELCKKQQRVTVFLVENAANAARAGAALPVRDALREAGAALCVDEFALRERGIPESELAAGLTVGNVEQIVDLLADSTTKAVWH